MTEDPDTIFVQANQQTLLRWFAYDFGDGSAVVTNLLGLTPVSPEGHEIELAQSKERCDAVESIVPFFGLYATIIGPFVANVTKSNRELAKKQHSEDWSEEEFDEFDAFQHQQLLFHILTACFAAAVNTKIIVNVGEVALYNDDE